MNEGDDSGSVSQVGHSRAKHHHASWAEYLANVPENDYRLVELEALKLSLDDFLAALTPPDGMLAVAHADSDDAQFDFGVFLDELLTRARAYRSANPWSDAQI